MAPSAIAFVAAAILAALIGYALADVLQSIALLVIGLLTAFFSEAVLLVALLHSSAFAVVLHFPELRPPHAHPIRRAALFCAVALAAAAVMSAVAPLSVFVAYAIFACRSATLPFTLFLGIRGLYQGRAVVHHSFYVQSGAFIALSVFIVSRPRYACSWMFVDFAVAVLQIAWGLGTSFALSFLISDAKFLYSDYVHKVKPTDRDKSLVMRAAAVITAAWWIAFWLGWTPPSFFSWLPRPIGSLVALLPFGPTGVSVSSPCFGDLAVMRGYANWSYLGMTIREVLVEWPIALLTLSLFIRLLCAKESALHAPAVILFRAWLRLYPSFSLLATVLTVKVAQLAPWLLGLAGLPLPTFSLPWLGGNVSEDEEHQVTTEHLMTELNDDVYFSAFPEIWLRKMRLHDSGEPLRDAAHRLGLDFEEFKRKCAERIAQLAATDEARDDTASQRRDQRDEPNASRRSSGHPRGPAANVKVEDPSARIYGSARQSERRSEPVHTTSNAAAVRSVPSRTRGTGAVGRTTSAISGNEARGASRSAAVHAASSIDPGPRHFHDVAATGSAAPEDPCEPAGPCECIVCKERLIGEGSATPAELRCGHVICAPCAGRATHCPYCDARTTVGLMHVPSVPAALPTPNDNVVDD